MGAQAGKDRTADVICQHKRDGTIIPIKIRIEDDDGELQVYRVKAYKDLSHCTDGAMRHMHKFECKIAVFGVERRIGLFYNSYDSIWKVSFLS